MPTLPPPSPKHIAVHTHLLPVTGVGIMTLYPGLYLLRMQLISVHCVTCTVQWCTVKSSHGTVEHVMLFMISTDVTSIEDMCAA